MIPLFKPINESSIVTQTSRVWFVLPTFFSISDLSKNVLHLLLLTHFTYCGMQKKYFEKIVCPYNDNQWGT